MSLKEAVLNVAELLEEEADGKDETGSPYWEFQVGRMLRLHARMLRNAVKAAGDALPSNSAMGNAPLAQHAVEVEKARAEFRQKRLQQESTDEPNMTLLVGGAAAGSWIPTDPAMPVGARTNINGDVYKLDKDGKLHHEPQSAILQS